MTKTKKFAMGGMNFNNSSSRRAPPPPVMPPVIPKAVPVGSGLAAGANQVMGGGFNSPAGQPVRAVPVQTMNTSGTPAGLAAGAPVGLAAMGGGFNGAGGQPIRAQQVPNVATGMKKGGKVSSASKRADGCCTKGKTRGKMM